MISRQMIHAVIWRFHGRRPMLQFDIFTLMLWFENFLRMFFGSSFPFFYLGEGDELFSITQEVGRSQHSIVLRKVCRSQHFTISLQIQMAHAALMISRQMIHAVIWRFHGRRPMLQFDIFTAIGSCFDLKFSCACSRGILGSSLIVKRFSLFIFFSHCTEDCQIAGWRHFTGDRQITGLVI